jgi:hypothetical protein
MLGGASISLAWQVLECLDQLFSLEVHNMFSDASINNTVSELTRRAAESVSSKVEAAVHAGPHAVEDVAITPALSILSLWFRAFADAIVGEFVRLYDRHILDENPNFEEEFQAYCWSLLFWRTAFARNRYYRTETNVQVYGSDRSVSVTQVYGEIRRSPTIWIPGLIYVLIHKIGIVEDKDLNITYIPVWGAENWLPWDVDRLEQWSQRWLSPIAQKKLLLCRRLSNGADGCPDTMMAFLAIHEAERSVKEYRTPRTNEGATVVSRRKNLPMVAGLFASCLGLTLCRTLIEPLAHYNPARVYAFTLHSLIWEGSDV